MSEPIRNGQVRPTVLRRIGPKHMIVVPMQQAQVMSIEQVQKALLDARLQIATTERALRRHKAYALDLEQQIEAFGKLPIDRDDEDPTVPQE